MISRRRHITARTVFGRTTLGVYQIYFVEAPLVDLIKIGITDNLQKRIYNLKHGSPIDLQMLLSVRGTAIQEHALHQAFAGERRRGEWFVASDRLRAFIRDLRAASKADVAATLDRLVAEAPAPVRDWKQPALPFPGRGYGRDIQRSRAKTSLGRSRTGLDRFAQPKPRSVSRRLQRFVACRLRTQSNAAEGGG